jgi:hypothetical protein
MTVRETLELAMRRAAGGDVYKALESSGLAVVDEGTMSQAIHDVYCSIVGDHDFPNDKDHAQARAMLDSIRRASAN